MLHEEARKVLTDPALIQQRQKWEQRLRGLFAGDTPDEPIYLWGAVWTGRTDMYEDPEKRAEEALEELAEKVHTHREKVTDDRVFRPIAVGSALHGVHFVDKIFGAHVYELDDVKNNWQVTYLASGVGTLDRPDLDSNPTWAAAKAFARAFVSSGATFPIFQLPTIASALNIGLNLYGEKLLLAMMTEPDAARHDFDIINGVLLEIHDWYRANIPFDSLHQVASPGRYQPPGAGQICGCSNQLISKSQYDAFIADHDDAILSRYPNGGMIHLCGSHTQHIDTWREMASMTSIQVNDRASEDLEIYLDKLPEKAYYVLPCEGMPLARIEELAMNHRIVICGEPGK